MHGALSNDEYPFNRPVICVERDLIDEASLTEIWCRHLRLDGIGNDDDFFAIGGTSLQAASIFLEIEDRTGIELPITVLFDAPTIAELAKHVNGRRDAGSGSLVLLKPGDRNAAVFLVHPVGGTVLVYRELAAAMTVPAAIYGIQASGLHGEGPLHTSVEDMAEHYCEQILKIQPEGPFRLAGYSAGGIIAFAMAQRIIENGKEVAFLGLINSHFVFRRTEREVGYFRRLHAYIQYARERKILTAVREFQKYRHHQQKLQNAEAMLDNKGTTFEQRREKLARKILADNEGRPEGRYSLVQQLQQIAINFYSPTIYRGAINLYKTADYHENRPGDIGWARLAAGTFKTAPIPGTHLSLIAGDNAIVLGALLSHDLKSSWCSNL